MDDYISKPINALELQQKLQQLAVALYTASAPLESAAAAPLVDGFDYTAALASVDQEVVAIIAEAFIEQWPGDLQKLHVGLAVGDASQVLHAAHALKGTLSTFGARPASEIAHRMESAASAGDLIAVQLQVESLAAQVGQLIAALEATLPS